VLPVKEIARRGRDEELQRVSYVEKQYEGEEGAGSSSFDVPGSRSCWDPSWPIFSDEPTKKRARTGYAAPSTAVLDQYVSLGNSRPRYRRGCERER